MTDGIRLFVATTLPTELKTFLQQQVRSYDHPSIRSVPGQNLHLTLFFIGNTLKSELPAINETLQKLSTEHGAFKLQYLCTEPGPNPRSPRLIWARFVQHPEFEKLSRSLARALSPEQNAKQKPIPHITLARFKKDAPAPPAVPLLQSETGINFSVDSISLWQSELASPHPIYSVLQTFKLATKP